VVAWAFGAPYTLGSVEGSAYSTVSVNRPSETERLAMDTLLPR
jgi:hypothetical protein